MSIKIRQYQHGDRDLWIALGPFATSRGALAELGGEPIYSTPETSWLVAYDGDAVVGFVSWRRTKTGTYYDYAYVAPDRRHAGLFGRLAAQRDESAASPLPLHALVRAPRVKHYRKRGWKVQSVRGAWSHMVKVAA